MPLSLSFPARGMQLNFNHSALAVWIRQCWPRRTGLLKNTQVLPTFRKTDLQASIQDGVVGRYTLLPCKTKRITTNLKTKNNQNFQNIKLYGSLTTKELKKKQSSRTVEGVEMGSWDGEDAWQGGGWQTGWSHIRVQKSREDQLGSETDCATHCSSVGN